MKLNEDYDVVRGQLLAIDPLPLVNRAYYPVQQQVERQKQVTNSVFEHTTFFVTNNNNNNKVVRFNDSNDGHNGENHRKDSKNSGNKNWKNQGHAIEVCFERIGYPKWWKGKTKVVKTIKPIANNVLVEARI